MSLPSLSHVDVDAVAAAIADGRPSEEVLDLADGALERASEDGDRTSLARLATLLTDAAGSRSDARGLTIAAARARAAAAAVGEPLPAPGDAATPTIGAQPTVHPAVPVPDLRYAGWWPRALAYTIDWLALLTVIGLAAPDSDAGEVIAFLVLPYAYFAILHALWRGQTLGKAVLGIAVRRDDGGLIGLSSALVRSLVQGLLWITIIGGIVDSLAPLADTRRRSLHDRAATTVVVRVR
jgi:uncharacterized RDD family membrane protein YckC